MRLQIIAGSQSRDAGTRTDGLDTLYQSGDIVIRGSGNIRKVVLDDGRQAFLIGSILGARTLQDEIRTSLNLTTTLKEILESNPIERCPDLLEGRFLLAMAGPSGRCSVCADRYGKIDLYYKAEGSSKVVASDLSLFPEPPDRDGYNQESLVHFLTVYGYRPPKRHTIYKNVHRLGVGELLTVSGDEIKILETAFTPLEVGNYGEPELNRYADILLEEIRMQGSRYGNVVSLSSGWDSTSILAALVHIYGPGKVRAVIGRMLYAERSGVINQFEINRAKAVADYFGVRLDVVDYDYRQKGPDWLDEKASFLKDNTIASISTISQALLYDSVASTSNGNETLFVGEISDAVHNLGFSQYTTIFHPVQAFREYSDKMASYLFGPTFLKAFREDSYADDQIYTLLRGRARGAIFDEPSAPDPRKRTLQLLSSFFLRANRLPMWSMKNSKMLTQQAIERYTAEMESAYLQAPAEAITPETLYSWYLHLYNSFHWQCSMISGRYLLGDEYGLNVALPFWNSCIQDFLSAMPEDWGRGLDLKPTKYPLKWMLQNRIDYPMHLQVGPHSYLYDVDPAFSHSAEIVYGSAFAPYFKGVLQSRPYRNVLDKGFFNYEYIDNLVSDYVAGKEIRGQGLSDLFSLCMLHMSGWYGMN